jgi:uncharacterized HAD superfamily protein/hypoxanthine phosphoribosyltransferase
MSLNIVSYSELMKGVDHGIRHLCSLGLNIDAVVPVLRSGMIPAFRISEKLHKPILIDDKIHGGLRVNKGKPIKTILIVDDSIHNGNSLKKCIDQYKDKYDIFTYCVIAAPHSIKLVDFHSLKISQPRIFEWNMFNTNLTSTIMFDMDGVFCFDPTVFDDDGEKYQNQLINARPLFIPTWPIHSIVTNRINRWRDITEKWLQDHHIKYGHLTMQNFPTAQERREKSPPYAYKASHYLKSNARLFIESEKSQASRIHQISGKPVYSIEGNIFYK